MMRPFKLHDVVLPVGLVLAVLLGGCASTTKLPKPFGQLSKDAVVERYFKDRDLDLIEGIWITDDNFYEIAFIRNSSGSGIASKYEYIGILTDTRRPNWQVGETKVLLKKTVSDYVYSAIYFNLAKEDYGTTFTLPNENMVEMSLPTGPYGMLQKTYLLRTYPPRGGSASAIDKSNAIKKTGSGFFVTSEIVATNYHVVADSREINVTWNERRMLATIVMKDQVNDLALLKVAFPTGGLERNLATTQVSPLPVGDVRAVKDGDKVFTVGFPLTSELGKRARVSEGIVNSTVGFADDPRMLQMSVPIQPGNSGGPLFNTRGEIVGIVTSTINNAYLILQKGAFPQNLNFAVKINYLNNLISLLPGDIKLSTGTANRQFSASELMEYSKSSVVYIEASN